MEFGIWELENHAVMCTDQQHTVRLVNHMDRRYACPREQCTCDLVHVACGYGTVTVIFSIRFRLDGVSCSTCISYVPPLLKPPFLM